MDSSASVLTVRPDASRRSILTRPSRGTRNLIAKEGCDEGLGTTTIDRDGSSGLEPAGIPVEAGGGQEEALSTLGSPGETQRRDRSALFMSVSVPSGKREIPTLGAVPSSNRPA